MAASFKHLFTSLYSTFQGSFQIVSVKNSSKVFHLAPLMFLSSGIHSSLINIQNVVIVVVLESAEHQIGRCALINKNVCLNVLGRCLLYLFS